MSLREIDRYIERCKENEAVPLFFFYDLFKDLYKRRRIREHSVITVRNRGAVDDHYRVTGEGALEFLPAGNQKERPDTFDPKKVLSYKNATYGWEVEPLFPALTS